MSRVKGTRLSRAREDAETGMMAPSFPSERKRVKSAEDRSPDLRLFQPPSQKRALAARSQWFIGLFRVQQTSPGCNPAFPITQYDGLRSRGAHSCGAVAGFHRFPEHPDDCRGELRCPRSSGSRYLMEPFSMTSTFIDGSGHEVKSRGVKQFPS
jgi:hypothetical protein